MQNVKDYITNELNKFVLANIIIVLLLSGQLDFLSEADTVSAFGINLTNIAIVASPLYIYIMIFNYLYSPKVKYRIIFWCSNMPGETVFSKIRTGEIYDPRFTVRDVISKYSDIYQEIDHLNYECCKCKLLEFENSSWYEIYQQYINDPAIADSLRGELLFRDMCVITLNMFLLLVLLYVIGYGYVFNVKCYLFLLGMYAISNLAARNRSKRLVMNVIAKDISSTEKKSGD